MLRSLETVARNRQARLPGLPLGARIGPIATAALAAAADFAPPSVLGPCLTEALAASGTKVTVRRTAVRLLRRHRIPRHLDVLLDEWARPTLHPDVRIAIAVQLRGAYEDPRAVAALGGAERSELMNLYRRYFDLVASGRKNIEARVQYPNLRSLAAGDHIRFICGTDDALTRVKRVARYSSFEQMLDTEGPARVSPDSSREQQLANIRRIYGPEKEAFGVLAIETELV